MMNLNKYIILLLAYCLLSSCGRRKSISEDSSKKDIPEVNEERKEKEEEDRK